MDNDLPPSYLAIGVLLLVALCLYNAWWTNNH